MRKALNFGHTIGHGIEAVKGIKGRRTVGLFHGECVALGMLPMIESKALQKRVRAVYRRIGLPTRTTYNKAKGAGQRCCTIKRPRADRSRSSRCRVWAAGGPRPSPWRACAPLLGVEE